MSAQRSRSSASLAVMPGDPVARIAGVGPKRAEDLARLGVYQAEDLLTLWPRRYQDRTTVTPIAAIDPGSYVTVLGRVLDVRVRPAAARGPIGTVTVTDASGVASLVFFYARYLERQMPVGQWILAYGRARRERGRVVLVHPEWEPVDPTETPGIVPVYPLAGGLTQRWMRHLMERVIPALAVQVADPLPDGLRARLGLVERASALVTVHRPPSWDAHEAARRRLVFDEMLVMALGVQWMRRRQVGRAPAVALTTDGPRVQRLLATLPFTLTPGQQAAWDTIRQDLAQPVPMARLLQGEVGSGKTVVAALALAAAADSGVQAAVMAPTELLADQQATVLARWLSPLGVTVLRWTGADTRVSARRRPGAPGTAEVVVGTQALIQDTTQFRRLGLVIIDEQHRFGVRQRAQLTAKGHFPHLLVMTATPIPRTLALTVYGDLEMVRIEGVPPGRQPIATERVTRTERRRVYQQVLDAIRRGEQAYVVCPFVDETDVPNVKTAVGVYEGMRRIAGWRVGLLHGRQSADEKERAMDAFRRGDLDVLVTTTIIEVGVDVPNATVMVIEDADRFGLAQLHQLRGRVGRGHKPGRCFLVADPGSEEAEARLAALVASQDGLELAERDLALRGPGEVLGIRQHGVAGFQLADPEKDWEALREARRIAAALLDRDPELTHPEHHALRQRVLQALGDAVPGTLLH